MSSFNLTIVTPDGLKFEGPAESVKVYASDGAVQILANHVNFVTTLGMGPATVVLSGERRQAACIGGMLSFTDNNARLIATSFEWAEDIDLDRAKNALARAEESLSDVNLTPAEKVMATAAKQRALVRISCANAR